MPRILAPNKILGKNPDLDFLPPEQMLGLPHSESGGVFKVEMTLPGFGQAPRDS